jgi:metallophosphoesterase (TIGR00282 family)
MTSKNSNSKTKTFNLLFIGDIVGEVGRETVKKLLPQIKSKYKVDFVMANGEHLSDRVGIDVEILREMHAAGIDFFTTGNHVWRNGEFKEEIAKKNMPIVRPANFLAKYPGHGFRTVTTPIGRMLIMNLLGKEGIKEKVVNPFKKALAVLDSQTDYDFAVVDFHAEMSSEKVAMGHFLDGKVAAVLGTHTHVPTADARILPQGTAFISDVGMTGPRDSVLGVRKEIITERFWKGTGGKFEVSDQWPGVLNAVLVRIDKECRAVDIERIDIVVESA